MPLTQAQIDAMTVSSNAVGTDLYAAQHDLGILEAQINALVADVNPPPVLDSVTRYDGSFFGSKVIRLVAVSKNGVLYPDPRPLWSTYNVGPARSPIAKSGDVCGNSDWGTSREYHRVPVAKIAGQQWLFIDGYGTLDGTAFYPVETINADWVNVDTGTAIDVTPPGPAPQGQPYQPALVPTSGHFRLRNWGWVWSSMTAGRSAMFYWEGDFTFGQELTDVAWKTDGTTTRACYKMSEGWWQNGSWIRATGDDPFAADGTPRVPTTQYLGWNANARDAGTVWTYDYPPDVVAVESIKAM